MATRLEWRGKQVAARVRAATEQAVTDTVQAAANDARATHWWGNRRGQLAGEVVAEPARTIGSRTTGRFGSTRTRGFYGLILEYRTPWLRPAADRNFPDLAGRIRWRLG